MLKYFTLEEIVPRDIYVQYGGKEDKLWLLFDNRILRIADAVRKRYGRVLCNTWKYGGSTQHRGFRPFGLAFGAELSQHKFGRALDLFPLDNPVEGVREDIIALQNHRDFKELMAIELKVSWLHLDVRNWDKGNNGLLQFNP